MEYTCADQFEERAKALVEGSSNKEYVGSIALSVRTLREVLYKESRCFAVYDTAMPRNSAHAEIIQTENPPQGTPDVKKVRAKIRQGILSAVTNDGRVVTAQEIFRE